MTELTYSRVFACRPAELWPWLTESDKLVQWLKGTEEHRYLTPGPLARGTKIAMKIKEGRRSTLYEGELLAVEPLRFLSQRMTGGCGSKPMTIESDYRLTDLGGSTRVDYVCRMILPPGLLWRIMGALGRLMGKAMIKRFFDGLSKLVER
jgi:uncharacterized protein YndB with AHSA1/START domain